MKGTFNATGIQEQGTYTLLPDGEYDASITKVVDKKAKSGNPMVAIQLTIFDNEYAGNWVWDNIVFAEGIMGRTKHFLHCIGEPYEGDKVQWDSDKWMNREVRILVARGEYNGRERNEVKGYILVEDNNDSTGDNTDKPDDDNPL